jgi:hypothetical protein
MSLWERAQVQEVLRRQVMSTAASQKCGKEAAFHIMIFY